MKETFMVSQLMTHLSNTMTYDLRKQKALDSNSRAIQQIFFSAADNTRVKIYYILEQSKEIMLEFFKGTAKAL